MVRAAAAGDLEAFGRLVERYQGRIHNLVGRMVGSRDAVQDLVQEVFIKAFRKIGDFRFESSFYTWLYTIALNTCRNYYRQQKPATVEIDEEEDAEMVTRVGTYDAPDEAVYRRQRAVMVREALERLLPEQREAVVMCDLEGLSYAEIADILGVPIGTVRSRIFRARAHLRSLLPAEVREG